MERKVDELGRIVLPIEYREALGIREKDNLELILEPDRENEVLYPIKID